MKILSLGAMLFHGDERTDITKLRVAFRNFADARENGPRLRGHKEKGIIHRNALLYRKNFDAIGTCRN